MKEIATIIALATALLATPATSLAQTYPSYNVSPAAADSTGVESSAAEIASRIKLGWNIGNTLEATGGETEWGNPKVTKKLIQQVKNSGFDAIRLPTSWDQYSDQKTARISPRWIKRVRSIVETCIENDLYVVLNIHWDGGWLERNVTPEKQSETIEKQRAYWEQIATSMRDFDERLMFASANEPHAETPEQMQVLLSYHQTFVDAVRSTGGRNAYRVLIVQGPNTDVQLTYDLMDQLPVDTVPDKLMAEVHYYTPYNFTLMEKDLDWGPQHYYWGEKFHSKSEPHRNATFGEESDVDRLFGLMKEKFVDQGVPVLLGEFGAIRRSSLKGEDLERHLASRAYFLEYVTRQANANGLLPFYWDAGFTGPNGSGIFHRRQAAVFDQLALDSLKNGASSSLWEELARPQSRNATPVASTP